MASNTSLTDAQEISFKDSLQALAKKWWLILGVLLACVALAFTATSISTNKYEAITRLLIVPRVVQTVQTDTTAPNPRELGPELSVEALSTLATARDLMLSIIVKLNLRDSSGNLWSVDRLARMISPTVETAGRAGLQTSLPLLTINVKGDDPKLVKTIAETWATFFVEQNVQLFATEPHALTISSLHNTWKQRVIGPQPWIANFSTAAPIPSR